MQNKNTATASAEHTIRIPTDSYNERRFGKPYIATVDFSTNPRGDFEFGDWVGHKGEDGILVLKAPTGTVVTKGQKDYRGSSDSEWGIVEPDGTIEWCETKAEAYALWLALQESRNPEPTNPLAGFTVAQLEAELERRKESADA